MAEQTKELKNVLQQIEKDFGKGAIMTLGDSSAVPIKGISTGALSLDMALGGRGIPRGRIVEVYGPESSGKTTIALHAIANVQKEGGVAAFIDAEHALDPSWAKRIGVDLEALLVSQPNNGEEALRIAEMLVKSNAVDLVVIDSVAALVPRNEINGEIGDSHVGLQARLMSQSLRMLNPQIAKTDTCMIFINQIRQKVGVMFGNPETTSGGLALKFFASVRMEVRKTSMLKDGDETVGSEMKVKIVKNKVAPPFKVVELDLMHNRGISWEGDILDLAVKHKIIDKSGAWFNYENQRLGQGRENVKNYLRENLELVEELKTKVLEACGYTEGTVEPEAIEAPAEEPALQEAGDGGREEKKSKAKK